MKPFLIFQLPSSFPGNILETMNNSYSSDSCVLSVLCLHNYELFAINYKCKAATFLHWTRWYKLNIYWFEHILVLLKMNCRVAPFVGKFTEFVRFVITTVRKLCKLKYVRVVWSSRLFHL